MLGEFDTDIGELDVTTGEEAIAPPEETADDTPDEVPPD